MPVACDRELKLDIFCRLVGHGHSLELLSLHIVSPLNAIALLLDENLLCDINMAHILNIAVVNAKIESRHIPRLVDTVWHIYGCPAYFRSTHPTLLLKLQLRIEQRRCSYRSLWCKKDRHSGSQHAFAILINHKFWIDRYKLSFQLVDEFTVLLA